MIAVNGKSIGTLVMSDPNPREYALVLPAKLLHRRNLLSFDLARAEVPKNLGINSDVRLLGIKVEWIQIDPDGK